MLLNFYIAFSYLYPFAVLAKQISSLLHNAEYNAEFKMVKVAIAGGSGRK